MERTNKEYHTIKYCTKCKVELTDKNWHNSYRRKGQYLCKYCDGKKSKRWVRQNRICTNNKVISLVRKRLHPGKCELCGANYDKIKLDYHHWDDETPELGIWVCYKCHRFVEGIEYGLSSEKYMDLKIKIIQETLQTYFKKKEEGGNNEAKNSEKVFKQELQKDV